MSDFGLGKMMTPDRQGLDVPLISITAGQVVGTPTYMAPEQAEGRSVLPSVDVYALGVIAYELLVGVVPFQGETPLRTLLQIISAPLPPPRERNPALTSGVEQALVKSLAREPEARYVKASAFVDALDQLASPSQSQSVTRLARTFGVCTLRGAEVCVGVGVNVGPGV